LLRAVGRKYNQYSHHGTSGVTWASGGNKSWVWRPGNEAKLDLVGPPPLEGSGGMLSQENFGDFRCSEVLSGAS